MKGRLLSILRSARNSCDNNNILTTTHSKSLSVLTPRRLVGFAHDIAKGMEYIASKNVSCLTCLAISNKIVSLQYIK